jgi:hypothetical protein
MNRDKFVFVGIDKIEKIEKRGRRKKADILLAAEKHLHQVQSQAQTQTQTPPADDEEESSCCPLCMICGKKVGKGGRYCLNSHYYHVDCMWEWNVLRNAQNENEEDDFCCPRCQTEFSAKVKKCKCEEYILKF